MEEIIDEGLLNSIRKGYETFKASREEERKNGQPGLLNNVKARAQAFKDKRAEKKNAIEKQRAEEEQKAKIEAEKRKHAEAAEQVRRDEERAKAKGRDKEYFDNYWDRLKKSTPIKTGGWTGETFNPKNFKFGGNKEHADQINQIYSGMVTDLTNVTKKLGNEIKTNPSHSEGLKAVKECIEKLKGISDKYIKEIQKLEEKAGSEDSKADEKAKLFHELSKLSPYDRDEAKQRAVIRQKLMKLGVRAEDEVDEDGKVVHKAEMPSYSVKSKYFDY